MKKTLVILGSTGSIGEQALDVARQNGYTVRALAAGKSIEKLEKQAREFNVESVAVFDEDAAIMLSARLSDTKIKVLSGTKGVCEVAALKADIVLNAIVGIAGGGEAEPCPDKRERDHVFLILKVKENFLTIHGPKAFLEVKREGGITP